MSNKDILNGFITRLNNIDVTVDNLPENIVDNGPTMAWGEIEIASAISNLVIEHNLGVAPSKFAVGLYGSSFVISESNMAIFPAGTKAVVVNGLSAGNTVTPTITETSITVPRGSSYDWGPGTYWWVAIE